jgi:acetoacetyl-CoA reductase/3-oxoacyl-[acyl-carrier protein] reductase
LALASDGYDVVLAARSTRQSPGKLSGTIDDVADRVAEIGQRALITQLDVRDEASVVAASERVYESFGRCDVLINNAGVITPEPLLETTTKRWKQVLDVNLTAPFVLTRTFAPRMLADGQGRVINISSGAAALPTYPFVSYCVSKRGLEALSEGLGLQAPAGLAVNALQVDAVIWSEGLAAVQGPEVAAEAESPEDVAKAVTWLVRRPIDVTGKIFTLSSLTSLGILG